MTRLRSTLVFITMLLVAGVASAQTPLGSNIVVKGTGGGGGGGASTPADLTASVQPANPLGDTAGGLYYDAELPATDLTYGWDSTFGSTASTFDEVNNLMGPFYNKDSINRSCTGNQFEHSFDLSWETAYNYSATDFETWVEHNWDIWSPLNDVVVTGASGGWSPAVNQYLTFSGTGDNDGKVAALGLRSSDFTYRQNRGTLTATATVTDKEYTNTLSSPASFNPTVGSVVTFNNDPGNRGVVVSWSGSVLVWKRGSVKETTTGSVVVQEAPADGGQQGTLGATITTTEETATVSSVTSACDEGDDWRPYLAVWDIMDDNVTYSWSTLNTTSVRDKFQVKNGAIAIGSDVAPSGVTGPRLVVEGSPPSSGAAIVALEPDDNGSLNGSRALDVIVDLGADNVSVSGITSGIYVDNIAEGTGTNAGAIYAIRIADMHDGTVQGSSSAAIYIDSQDSNALSQSSQHGNINFAGGSWNNGHLMFGTGQAQHIWFSGSLNNGENVFRMSTHEDEGFRPLNETDGAQILTGRPTTDSTVCDADGAEQKPEGYMFYNDTSDYYCFCNGSGDDVQVHSPTTACY